MKFKFNTILLVDDDEICNHLHCRIINKLGVARDVICQNNGKDAIDFIKSQYNTYKCLPSLILLDLNMPVMNGFEFIEEMKKSELLSVKNIPIAILTSSNATSDVERINELGSFFFVTKPLTEQKLLDILSHSFSKLVA